MAITKIARGGSGTVVPFTTSAYTGPFYDCYCANGAGPCPWFMESPSAQFTVGGDIRPCQTPDNSQGFSFEGTMVSVPANAQLGVYKLTVEATPDRDAAAYEFEVVCMTTKITVTETYRDEDKYRLSCTATPQGGTAPYFYNWSSTATGSQALSALNQATLEVEIPAIGVGSISVAVSDSSDPACTASASFRVCGSVNCDFSTAIISTPPAGATEPYIYKCISSSVGSFGSADVEHEWSPNPLSVSEDGRVAQFSFPDDDEHSIHLSVTDADGCRAFRTHKVGGYEFIVSTNPSGEDMGTVSGTRASMEFDVTVTAEATGNFVGPPPAQLTLEFSRSAINGVGTATAPLVAGSNPPRYQVVWRVTREKGRWQFKVLGVPSNTVTFKIDKRKQIVEVANSWIGASSAEIGGNCNDLTAVVYGHLGLPLPGGDAGTQAQYNSATIPCSGEGCLLFYSGVGAPDDNVAHVAIAVGGQRVNINSNTTPGSPVVAEDVNAGVLSGAPNLYKAQIESRSTVNLDED